MDLTSPKAEVAARFLRAHCLPQPAADQSLTWYAGAHKLYDAYARYAYREQVDAVTFNELWTVLRLLFPAVGAGKQGGVAVYTGIRYHTDDGYQNPVFS